MCIFITLIVEEAEAQTVSSILRRFQRGAMTLKNPSLQTVIGEGKVQLLTTQSMCDCGTMIGSGDDEDGKVNILEKEISRLKRKKWSDAKIKRALASKLKSQENKPSRASDSLKMWIALIDDCLNSNVSRVGIFHQMYRGSVHEEIMRVESAIIKRAELTEDRLRNLPQETILYIHV